MNAALQIVQFVGGPSDGLVLRDPHFVAHDTLRTPIGAATVRCGRTQCYELIGYWYSAYRLTSSQRRVEEGRPTTYARYEFAGYELSPLHGKGAPRRHHRPRWLLGMRDWFRQLPRRFASWMMEPIDDPLKARGDDLSTTNAAKSPRAQRV